MNIIETENITLEIKKKDFIKYFVKYLKNHTYLKNKNIASDYSAELFKYNSKYHNDNLALLTRRFMKIAIATHKLGLIIRYNKTTYKVIKPANFETLENRLIKMVKIKSLTIGATY